MAEVGEGGRAAAAFLWSRRGGGHYKLLCPPDEEEVQGAGEKDRERTDVEKVEKEVEMVRGGEVAEDQGQEVGKRDRRRSECGRTCSRCIYRVEARGGGTGGKSVPYGNEGRGEG